ncbi:MAG: isoleucine--tRNA ligase [Candidatus Doudnabacteria bacterium]|nr:isoleucine--tRNA ligase [Candidatus Doudnabacteria bacterium]MCA9387506.1 isoleucine--tRNA ligase [Candidatus Andersenbacteria bacterium]
MPTRSSFESVPSLPNMPELERHVLQHWDTHNLFERSVQERPVEKSFTFYDGPPFATGLPHYGHILTSVLKDLIPRFKTMQGYRVERRWGWDCHGLPIENIIEKELGLNSKKDIEDYGVDKFNNACHATVLKYAEEWQTFINRIGRWVDFDNDYRTMDRDYMESVWWAFKELVDKELVYESYKVLWYCTRCATPLSNFEAGLDDAYRKRQDPSLTFKVRLQPERAEGLENTWLWLWTTTAWTVPSHMAVAVNPELEYVLMRHEETGEGAILAKARVESYAKELQGFSQERVFKGSELLGWTYDQPFDFFASKREQGAFRIVSADFVTDTDGTGLAHEAPAFGVEDFEMAQKEGVPIDARPIDASGQFVDPVVPYKGVHVHEAQPQIIKDLKERGVVVRHDTYEHNYPHCWRCDTPLIQNSVETWFVAVTQVRDQLVQHNQKIRWVPDRVKDGIFGNWLEGARDWAVSRNRYWGAPIPVWKCTDCEAQKVVGSVEELESLSGADLPDIHKHLVDDLEFPCVSGGGSCSGIMRRVSEVFDCWFESGSMPYAQQHYPFENQEEFERSFPGDFITEYVGQTRGWFYTMTVLAGALFGREPFKNVIVHGIVLAEDGRKMSKRLQNYPDPTELVDKYGADALRLYLMSSPVIRGDDMRFSEKELVELMRRTLFTLWNVYGFFQTYASVDNFEPQVNPPAPTHVLDKWVLSRLQTLKQETTADLEAYEVQKYERRLEAFIEDLSNWYVRRSRRRFWKSEDDADKQAAEQTLYTVLLDLSKVMAPVTPFLAETMYQGLTRGTAMDSVHLEPWPEVDASLQNADVEEMMARTRELVNLGHSARDIGKQKVRQPLATVKASGSPLPSEFVEIVADELNVKEVVFEESLEDLAEQSFTLNTAKAGPILKQEVGAVKKAVEAGDVKAVEEGYEVAGHVVSRDLVLVAYVGSTERWAVAGDLNAVVAIDTQLTPELEAEGHARELIREVQKLRKEAGYAVEDRIELECVGAVVQSVLDATNSLVADEVLATAVRVVEELDSGLDATSEVELGGSHVIFGISKV